MDQDEGRVTYAQAAEILGCHVSNVAKLVAKGQLRSERRRDGAFLRVDVERLAQLRQLQRTQHDVHQVVVELTDQLHHDQPRAGTRPDAEHVWLTPAQAGEQLGITGQAVNKRLLKGTMPGERVGRRWWVRADHLELVANARAGL